MPNQTNNPTELIESIQSLRVENARLIALLQSHGIDGQLANNFDGSVTLNASDEVGDSGIPGHLAAKPAAGISNADKIALFRRLFRGRTDVYSLRWESKKSGNSGYAPTCANEWRAGVCNKPRIKCGDCNRRELITLSDTVIHEHLTSKKTIGIYPLLEDDTCYFLAVDFDEEQWRDDV
ncbi:hypothetical protein ICN48_10055 [Polynucleobacter sp. JS-Safj-400b-B2]|uniref:TOTE conflict system archaeo-eukaryotic primase domain-containing protein n=1 Tax=Polynucleobacter sp. JS-Safj-400b-B2 TaxID=2576921 RepID=UPI001C0B1894|nr:hypothetical protein [Polynucleobacter sp. JS-Safj-400b-B2]MBU3626576.1 hypothetical protein [Polynucleobacter sp. JS-Safj-400b-B2]